MNFVRLFILVILLFSSVFANAFEMGKVIEVKPTKSYTYILLEQDKKQKQWIVVEATEGIDTGAIVRYKKELTVNNFKSKMLDETFGTVIFASNLQYHAINK